MSPELLGELTSELIASRSAGVDTRSASQRLDVRCAAVHDIAAVFGMPCGEVTAGLAAWNAQQHRRTVELTEVLVDLAGDLDTHSSARELATLVYELRAR